MGENEELLAYPSLNCKEMKNIGRNWQAGDKVGREEK